MDSKAERPFKVVIVGAGFAGLSLAIMLERLDIDYVLLEARDEIAPLIGAGIALCPNGLRILDQIGCYESLVALGLPHILETKVISSEGETLLGCRYTHEHNEMRSGYPILFVDRPNLVRLLHDKIQNKDKIFLGQRVANVELDKDGVRVHTTAGQTFEGSIVVGADGIYSPVREEMYRLAKELQPGTFPEDPSSKVPAPWFALYGITKDVPGLSLEETCIYAANGFAYYVFPGHEGRAYYFVSERFAETKYGKDVPRRFTAEEEAKFVDKYKDIWVNETVRFKDIYDHRIAGGITPLHLTVYDKWSFRRIVLIGDSVHKPDPGTGMGANQAFESAAVLANGIMKVKKARPQGLAGLTDGDIAQITDHLESTRKDRAREIIKKSHDGAMISVNENPLISWLGLRVMPWILKGTFVVDDQMLEMKDGASLDDLPKPRRPHVQPYTDELPSQPVGKLAGWAAWAAFGGAMGAVVYLAGKSLRLDLAGMTHWAGTTPIARPWTGIKGVGRFLQIATSLFSDVIAGENPAARIQVMHGLSQMLAPVLIWTIEGRRVANTNNLIALPALFLLAMQVKGMAFVAPVWAFLHATLSDPSVFYRHVRTDVVRALIPAVTLGYLLPTALMLAPTPSVAAWQDRTALWQLAPPLVPVLVSVLSSLSRRWRTRTGGSHLTEEERVAQDKREQLAMYTDDDVPGLKAAYSYATLLQAAGHMTTVAYALTRPGLSLGSVFCGVPSPFAARWDLPSRAAGSEVFFKYDVWLSAGAWAAHGLYAVWQLRRDGYVRTRDAVRAALGVVVGNVVIGPGATWTSLWSWRESAIAGLMVK